MTTQLLQIKWSRVTLSTLSVYIFSFLLMMVIVIGYATYLGFQARGMPNPDQIQQFANQYAPLLGMYGLIPFTFLAAWRMASKIETAPQIHGVVLGVLVSVLNVLISGLSVNIILPIILIIGGGWLGSNLGTRR